MTKNQLNKFIFEKKFFLADHVDNPLIIWLMPLQLQLHPTTHYPPMLDRLNLHVFRLVSFIHRLCLSKNIKLSSSIKEFVIYNC